jgi:hypothetical protein
VTGLPCCPDLLLQAAGFAARWLPGGDDSADPDVISVNDGAAEIRCAQPEGLLRQLILNARRVCGEMSARQPHRRACACLPHSARALPDPHRPPPSRHRARLSRRETEIACDDCGMRSQLQACVMRQLHLIA